MSGTLTRHTGHKIVAISMPHWRKGLPSRLTCECTEQLVVETLRDQYAAHRPLEAAYAAHRLATKAGVPHPIAYERNGWDFGQAIPGTAGEYRPKEPG